MYSKHLSPYRRSGRLPFLPAAGLALLTALSGCSGDELAGSADPAAPGGAPVSYVRLDFAMPSAPAGRAALRPLDNPADGENGDGLEIGQTAENEVRSAVAFFFQPAGDENTGVNADASTPVTAVYFPTCTATAGPGNGGTLAGSPDTVYTTGSTPTELKNGTYQVLVVANPGEDQWWTAAAGALTLGQVRDRIQAAAWTESAGSYSDFVMTSAADATLTLNSNKKEDPATTTVSVERMAARVDYAAEKEVFECTDPTYQDATVVITGAAVVNNFTAGSYLLKRVTAGTDDLSTYTYLGAETADDAGAATNYVLDPWTAYKTENNHSFTVGSQSVDRAGLYGVYLPEGSQDPNVWADYVTAGTPMTGTWDGRTWNRAGYTLENVTKAEASGRAYSTAVVFKAKFYPVGLSGYAEGNTFFAWGSALYPSMEAVMAAAYGSNWQSIQDAFAAATTWDEVRETAKRLLTNDPSGYDDYINGLLGSGYAEGELDEAERSTLAWTYYMSHVCGYTCTTDGGTAHVTLDQTQDGTSTREKLEPYGIRTYEDATCYYTWFVRHANDGVDYANGPMEYAIVRNNIYKLLVTGVYSLGDDVPGDETLRVHLYVNDWLLLPREDIEM